MCMGTLEKITSYDSLDEEKRLFVDIYLMNFNILRAANKIGVPVGTARCWLKHKDIKLAIQDRKRDIQQKCDITLEECLNELAKIAFYDHKDATKNIVYDEETKMLKIDMEAWEDVDTSAIQEFYIKQDGNGKPYVVFKPYNKLDALKELMNRLEGTNGDKHLHLHMTKDEMGNLSSKENSNVYQQLVQNAMTN